MGSDDEFGPDTAAIRAWLDKRATYAADREVPPRPVEPSPAPVAPPVPRPAPRLPDTHDIGRSVLDALGVPSEAGQDEQPVEKPAEQPAEPEQAAPPPAEPAPATYAVEEDDLPPAVIAFRPRTHVRRALTVVLLVALALAIGTAVLAWRQGNNTGLYAVAASLGVLVLVVWAVRASTIPTRVTIRRNQLEVVRSGRRSTLDLASPFTPVAILGTPGRRGWQVLVEQLEAPVLTLTANDVDPEPFMRVLLRLRPDLRPSSPDTNENLF